MHYFNETPTYYLKLSIPVITASGHIEYMYSGTIKKACLMEQMDYISEE